MSRTKTRKSSLESHLDYNKQTINYPPRNKPKKPTKPHKTNKQNSKTQANKRCLKIINSQCSHPPCHDDFRNLRNSVHPKTWTHPPNSNICLWKYSQWKCIFNLQNTGSLSAVHSCMFQHLSPCTATYEQCKTTVLNSTIIIIQCVQGKFYNNKNWHAFNSGYLTRIFFKKY